jgi:hypothetical protein
MTALRRARAACCLGAATSVPFAALMLFAHLTPDGQPFRYTGDYLLTALGIPTALAPLVLMTAPRPRAVGAWITCPVLALFVLAFAYAVVDGVARTYGPGYLLATLATDVGIALFAARCDRLPRPLRVAWALAWAFGGLLALPGAPLALGAVYLGIAWTLRPADRRVRASARMASLSSTAASS